MQPFGHMRPDRVGRYPLLDRTAWVDPSAQIIGNVRIGPHSRIGLLTVLRADGSDPSGASASIEIGSGVQIEEGVIVRSNAAEAVQIGPNVLVEQGVILRGPCRIGEGCVLGIRSILYQVDLEPFVRLGWNCVLSRVWVPEWAEVPANSLLLTPEDLRFLKIRTGEWERHERGKAIRVRSPSGMEFNRDR